MKMWLKNCDEQTLRYYEEKWRESLSRNQFREPRFSRIGVMRMLMSIKKILMWFFGLAGWLTSYLMFSRSLQNNDWDFLGCWVEAFSTSDFSTGLHLDLVFVTFMMISLAVLDRKSLGKKWTAAVLLSLSLSVSMSLCLYVVGKLQSQGHAQ